MKTKSSKMTLDKLAQITQQEFSHVNKRFDKIDERFVLIDKRFALVDERFEQVMEEIREIQQSNHDILSAVKVIIEHTTNDLRSRLDSFDRRLSAIEKSKR